MEIQNASTAHSICNQVRNVNAVRWEYWNITTQPGEIDDRNVKGDFYQEAFTILNRFD